MLSSTPPSSSSSSFLHSLFGFPKSLRLRVVRLRIAVLFVTLCLLGTFLYSVSFRLSADWRSKEKGKFNEILTETQRTETTQRETMQRERENSEENEKIKEGNNQQNQQQQEQSAPLPSSPSFPSPPSSSLPSLPSIISPPLGTLSPDALKVREAFDSAYSLYSKHCFGQDEMHPGTLSCSDWMHLGLTIVDALPTAIIMGFEEETQKAIQWIHKNIHMEKATQSSSLFEIIIRILGGLLSSYELVGDARLLQAAERLGDGLLPCFNTPHKFPHAAVTLSSRECADVPWMRGGALLAEVGTFQLEFSKLSELTGRSEFVDVADRVVQRFHQWKPQIEGLYPIYLNIQSGDFMNSKITFGAMGDSMYEYLLKLWVLRGRRDDSLRRLYLKSANSLIEHLVMTTPNGEFYVAELEGGRKIPKMDHLACFVPGMLALGAASGAADSPAMAERHLNVSIALLSTCVKSYEITTSHLGPEVMRFSPNLIVGDPKFHLRPETAESLFILWRITGDDRWRAAGREMMNALNTNCKLPNGGFTGLHDVNSPLSKQNKMESFFLAETLKYLFLLFTDGNVIPIIPPIRQGDSSENLPIPKESINKEFFVFNTECHPLKGKQ